MAAIETIDDMISAQYGVRDGRIMKDAAVLTSTTGAHNNLYSYGVFIGMCLEANAFGVIPKKPWSTTGYRAVQTPSATSGGGLTEGGAIPATTKAQYFQCDLTCKELAISFDMSDMQIKKQGKDDVLAWEDHKDVEAQTFDNLLNRQILVDSNTLAGTNLESLDRMTGNETGIITNHSYTGNDADPWALLDRSETTEGDDNYGSWADGYMSENSNTDREFSLSYVDTVIANVSPYWDGGSLENKVFITGYDTLMDWSQEFLPHQQLPQLGVQMTVNGVKTIGTHEAGLMVKSYDGIPIIASNNVAKDTKSRIYCLDLDYASLDMLTLPEYLESGDYQAIDKFSKEGVFHAQGELVFKRFKDQGAVWDLK